MQIAAVAALAIAVTPAPGAATHHWTLRCGPAGGTLPKAASACARLAKLDAPFAPLPTDAVCSQLYGGPEKATVVGTYRGRRVDAAFDRKDGCQIDRWKRLSFLFR